MGQSHFEFDKDDIAHYIVVEGLSSLLVQGILVKPLMDCFRERGVISLSMLISVLAYIVLIIAAKYPHRWLVFLYASMSGASSLAFPAVASLKSVHCTQSEQGQIQGALSSVKAVAGAIGPLFYAQLYKQTGSGWGITLPFAIAAILATICFVMSLYLPVTAPVVEQKSTLEPLLEETDSTGDEADL